jgi:hypothetical protein
MKYADLLYVIKKYMSIISHPSNDALVVFFLKIIFSFLLNAKKNRNPGRNVDILKFESDLLSALSSSDEENKVISFYTNGRSNIRATS